MKTSLQLFFGFFVLCCMSACGDDNGGGFKSSIEDPEEVAIAFMTSIYKDNDLNNAMSMSTPKLAKLLNRYRTNRNAQKNLVGQIYDQVNITPDSDGRATRREFAKQTSITLILDGQFNRDKIVELRRLNMIRDGKEWQVDAVQRAGF